ncbi:TetR/AcrR family transcriptional regulator [Lacticaseibacillus manihotivorans]|nr:TetR/AcrR family transcriptional regulator [Lacticaseibacillus manihotivorans]QFQ91078.1 TetR family transcriptional regulator [Lacticaseibacillus manihotivorans]
MVSTMYQNLPQAKQERVEAALLKEFSTHALADAQVARIVSTANIARGAFYHYFSDLQDAYLYLFGQVMQAVHRNVPKSGDMYQATADFVNGAVDSEYHDLLRQHFAHNAAMLPSHQPTVDLPPIAWAQMTLCHETIRLSLIDSEHKAQHLANLKHALAKLAE